MTNQSINEAILKRRGYKQYVGNKDNLSPLMFFFLADASFQVFDKDVSKQECKGAQKRLMNQMAEGFHLFFKDFFSTFDYEQTDYLLEKVDEFEAFIQHHLDIAEIAMQECCNDAPIEVQKELSRTWLCNILAADAQDFHGECWRTGANQPLCNRYLDQVLKASKEYARLRFGDGRLLTEKQFDRVQLSVKIVARKICDWIYSDYQNEINEKKQANDSAKDAGAGRGTEKKDVRSVGVRRRGEDKGKAIGGGPGDDSIRPAPRGMHDEPDGGVIGPGPLHNLALRAPYGGFSVIPRVRGGEGNMGEI